LDLALYLDPVRGHVMQERRAVGERRPLSNELGSLVQQCPQCLLLAPLDRIARRLEVGVDRIRGVRARRRPIPIAVVASDGEACLLEGERRGEHFVLRALSASGRPNESPGKPIAMAMCLAQQLDVPVQVLAQAGHSSVQIGHERARGHDRRA
jgi:hypothetical protein